MNVVRRYFSHVHGMKDQLKIKSWQIHEYGGIDMLQLGSARRPIVNNPRGVLVRVTAASVNPIDVLMIGGYGHTLFQIQRCSQMELPLTVGRDFAGVVVAKGQNVGSNLQIGDEVYGFIPLHKQGSFAEMVLADACHVLPKPKHLTTTESASLVYSAMTAWSALFIFGNLLFKVKEGLRVLVLGASGGVGNAAVQLLKSQNCVVLGTCSTDAVPFVYDLGADCVFDYKDPDYENDVASESKYHIILDCAKMGYQNIPKSWKYDSYITLNSPLLTNTDNYGLLAGLVHSANDLLGANLNRLKDSSSVRWGFFVPSRNGFEFINDLILKEKIRPVVQKVFKYNELPEAVKTVSAGHMRGKIVVDFNEFCE
ncbi:unnamed protein product [Phaedon cochleariae]|uniref:Enoyl reductase (ER) domain-containing protein n=1 Tax=Phaedon cochleariae TaxID=80249 RepID=A0A9P0DD81_PHACE|nr:unnamed protein product [Phaedon cochleariae]